MKLFNCVFMYITGIVLLKGSRRIFPVGKAINNKRNFSITFREIHFLGFKCFTASTVYYKTQYQYYPDNAAISNFLTTRSGNIDECPFWVGRIISTAMLTET